MNDSTYYESATCEYVRVIRSHVIHPLESTAVAENCFVAAMLVFGAIDGLGKLIHPDERAGVGTRFKAFLQRMGIAYRNHGQQIWLLRNALAHSAMNTACFMAKTEEARSEHLKSDQGRLFIHSKTLVEDFKMALDQLEREFRNDNVLFERAQGRLKWQIIDPWREKRLTSTQPPAIRYVQES